VAVTAAAADDVGVAGVQFKLDGANLGAEITVAPYQVSWNTTLGTNGSHTLTAVARDAAGNSTTSAAVPVTVNNVDGTAPTVSISAPAAGATVLGAVAVNANAADNIAVVGVQFKLDGVNLGAEDTAAPYSVSWNTLAGANGSHTLSAVARDGAGNTATAADVLVTVNNDLTAPTVSVTAPADGTTVSGSAVTVTASAADNVGVAGVQFLLDGAALGAELTAAPFTMAWNTLPVSNGAHALSARARDAAGNITTSATVSVTVSNVVSASPIVDVNKSKLQETKSKTVAVAGVTTTQPNELLLAFISTDQVSATAPTVTSIASGTLTWTLVKRQNEQNGTSEIWRAFAPAQVSNMTVTATLSQTVTSLMSVVSFSNVDITGVNGAGAIGAVGGLSKPAGAPVATLVTTRANSMVFGVGNDYDGAVARVVGAGQSMIAQSLSSVGDTYWVQRLDGSVAAVGTTVTINDTAPTNNRFNLAIVEIRPPS